MQLDLATNEPIGVSVRERGGGGVQSLERAAGLLEIMADAGGRISLSELATRANLPLPTAHRLMRTLVDIGFVRQEQSRQYALGPQLIRLGETSSRMLGAWARPYLGELVDSVGETANLAILDGYQIVYVAQVPSRHSMRMFTEVGRRVSPHCTAVGKALLAELPPSEVQDVLSRSGMESYTAHTITSRSELVARLEIVRELGYAVDEGEQEIGVRCVAVALKDAPGRIALSVSGPATRMNDDLVKRAAAILSETAQKLSQDLRSR